MKILVLSDSHGNLTNMERAFALEQPDAVFHLGDGAGDFARLCRGSAQFAAACGVAGNCDFGADCPTVRTAEYGGYRFFLTHGHQYQVKYSLMRLYYAAREALAESRSVCQVVPAQLGDRIGDVAAITVAWNG